MFASFSTSDAERSTSGTSTAEPTVLIDTDRQPVLPTDDDATENVSDDPLTDQASADEEVVINDESIDDLFANFNESLLDELLAV